LRIRLRNETRCKAEKKQGKNQTPASEHGRNPVLEI
jgi:hypothetical protein